MVIYAYQIRPSYSGFTTHLETELPQVKNSFNNVNLFRQHILFTKSTTVFNHGGTIL